MLFEDIPQLIIQIWLFISHGASVNLTAIFAAFAFTCVHIVCAVWIIHKKVAALKHVSHLQFLSYLFDLGSIDDNLAFAKALQIERARPLRRKFLEFVRWSGYG